MKLLQHKDLKSTQMILEGTQNEAFQLSKSMHGKLLIFCMKLTTTERLRIEQNNFL